MRLHRLSLTAFGSFPGREEVDFDALGEAGLFLVHGPTGAGKTTVLDAVCYALYGRVPGQRDSARRLRCDHAPPDRAPKVVLETTLRGRRLRIARSPAWDRPKLRGTGLVEEKPKILLEELTASGEWTFRSSRFDEAGDLIGSLLGMNADQFWQVAMLPQGDFARFLRADGDDRRKLLEKLFSVRLYTAIEQWLADHRTQTGQDRQSLRHHLDSTLNHMRGAAGPLLSPSAPTGLGTPADQEARTEPGTPGIPVESGVSSELDSPVGVGTPAGKDIPAEPGTPAMSGESGATAASGTPVGHGASAGNDTTSGLGWPDAEAEPAEWAAALLAKAAGVHDEQKRAAEASAAVLRAARDGLESGRELAKLQRAHAEALARKDELDRGADERSDLETMLAEAARADRVLPLVQQAEQRAEAAAKAKGLAADAIARALPLLTPTADTRISNEEPPNPGRDRPAASTKLEEGRAGGPSVSAAPHSGGQVDAGRARPVEGVGREWVRRDDLARLEGGAEGGAVGVSSEGLHSDGQGGAVGVSSEGFHSGGEVGAGRARPVEGVGREWVRRDDLARLEG
ncbi:AAA family ATPase, partial [Sphaerisporangium aureirubrum]